MTPKALSKGKKPTKKELQREMVIWMFHDLELFLLQPLKSRADMKRMAQTFINVVKEVNPQPNTLHKSMTKQKLLSDAENKIALGDKGVCYILEDLIDSYTAELKKVIEEKRKDCYYVEKMSSLENHIKVLKDEEYNKALSDVLSELNHQ